MAMAGGFVVLVCAASVGVTFGGVIGSLHSFMGVLAGANLIAVGVIMANDTAARVRATAPRALAAFLHRHLTVVGLAMASCAVTVIAGEAGPVLCFGMFAVLLLGLALINIQVLGK